MTDSRWKWAAMLAIAGATLAPVGASPALAVDATPAAGSCADLDVAATASAAAAWTDHAFTAEDAPEFDAVLAPDLVYHSAAFGDLDRAGWEAGQQQLAAAYPDGRITVNLTIVDAPYAVTQWTANATNEGEFQGTPAIGEAVSWDGINVFRFDCGRIVEAWTQLDQLGRNNPVPVPDTATASPSAPACADPEAATDDEVEQLIRTWEEQGWNEADAAAIDAITADDVLHHPPTGADTIGADAIMSRVADFRAAMPDLINTYGEAMIDGNLGAARWTATGTDTGGVMGAEPTGKQITMDGINIFRVSCGEIVEVWSEMDILGMMAQLEG